MNKSTRKGVIKTVIGVCAIIVTVLALFTYKMTQPRILSVKELVGMGVITYEQPKPVADFQLVKHTGDSFTRESLTGQWTLMFFGFSHCGGFCPATLSILNALMAELEPEVREQTQVVMVSVDPARDTPEVLADYVPEFNPEFVGVTGEFLDIKRFTSQFHVAFKKSTGGEDDYHVDHGEQLIMVNPQGRYHGFIKPPFTLGQIKVAYQSIVLSYEPSEDMGAPDTPGIAEPE